MMLLARFVRSMFVMVSFAGALAAVAATQAPTTTSLVLSAPSVPSGFTVTLTAAVKTSAAPVTLGQVAFCDVSHVVACLPGSANLLAVASVTSAGTASVKVRTGVGTHTIIAHFLGTVGTIGEAASTSAKQTLTVTSASGPIATTTSLTTVAQASSTPGATLYNLAATVSSPAGDPAPTGSVSFLATSPSTTTNVGSFALTTAPASPTFATIPLVGAGPNQGYLDVVADFNEDGILDVVATLSNTFPDPGRTFYVFAGVGDGTFVAPSTAHAVSVGCPGGDPCFVATGDFNGDGHADLVILEPTQAYPTFTMRFAYGDGKGGFLAGPVVDLTLSYNYLMPQILAGDFNGDGRLDVLVNNGATSPGSSTTSSLALLLQQPDQSFAVSYPSLALPLGSNIQVGDLNNDGKTDFATASMPGAAEIFLSNGDGTFTGSVLGNPIPIPNNDYTNFPLLADFNGDGVPDLALVDPANNQAVVYLNDGHANFRSEPVMTLYPPASFYPVYQSATLAIDVNGDGLADLLTSYEVNSSPALGDALLSKGDGSFTSVAVQLPLFFDMSLDLIADLNGDGLPDIASPAVEGVNGAGGFESGVLLNESVSGTATASASSVLMPAGGSLSLTASYTGQGGFAGSVSAPAPVTGSSVATTTTVSVSAAMVMAGQPVTVTATISPYSANGFATNGELINFSSYGTVISSPLNNGVATATFPNLPVGTVNVFAGYSGDSTFQGSMGSSSVVVTTGAASPAALKGTYAFLLKGLLPPRYGSVPGIAVLGYFTADGMGNITGGSEFVNSTKLDLVHVVTGTYSIQDNGIATLQLLVQDGLTASYNAVLSQVNGSGVAQKLSLVGLGTENTLLSGEAFAETTGVPFALSGTYAVELSGETFCTPSTCAASTGTTQGALIATETVADPGSGTGIGAGTENDAGVVSSLPGLQMSFTAPGANGVFDLSLISPGSTAQEPRYFAGIFVSPTKILVLSTEPHTSSALFSGTLSK